jgi:hypothetical protein
MIWLSSSVLKWWKAWHNDMYGMPWKEDENASRSLSLWRKSVSLEDCKVDGIFYSATKFTHFTSLGSSECKRQCIHFQACV